MVDITNIIILPQILPQLVERVDGSIHTYTLCGEQAYFLKQVTKGDSVYSYMMIEKNLIRTMFTREAKPIFFYHDPRLIFTREKGKVRYHDIPFKSDKDKIMGRQINDEVLRVVMTENEVERLFLIRGDDTFTIFLSRGKIEGVKFDDPLLTVLFKDGFPSVDSDKEEKNLMLKIKKRFKETFHLSLKAAFGDIIDVKNKFRER
jgi:hypothetical protein